MVEREAIVAAAALQPSIAGPHLYGRIEFLAQAQRRLASAERDLDAAWVSNHSFGRLRGWKFPCIWLGLSSGGSLSSVIGRPHGALVGQHRSIVAWTEARADLVPRSSALCGKRGRWSADRGGRKLWWMRLLRSSALAYPV